MQTITYYLYHGAALATLTFYGIYGGTGCEA